LSRFIVLFALGALLVGASQLALSLGTHPDHLASLRYILQSVAGLIAGVVLAIAGLLGLAEGYQRSARQIGPLLQRKRLDESLDLVVRSEDQLQKQNKRFWQAYRSAGLALALFQGGLFTISLLLGDSSFFHYIAGLSAGVAILGVTSGIWGLSGLHAARQCHKAAASEAALLDAQPDYVAENPVRPTTTPPRIRWASERRRPSAYSRSLSR